MGSYFWWFNFCDVGLTNERLHVNEFVSRYFSWYVHLHRRLQYIYVHSCIVMLMQFYAVWPEIPWLPTKAQSQALVIQAQANNNSMVETWWLQILVGTEPMHLQRICYTGTLEILKKWFHLIFIKASRRRTAWDGATKRISTRRCFKIEAQTTSSHLSFPSIQRIGPPCVHIT